VFDGIKVKVLNVTIDNKQVFIKRIWSFVKYAVLSSWYALVLPADVVIASSGPITVGIPGLIASYIRGKKLVFETRDLWPEGAIELGIIKNKLIKKTAYWFERTCYRASSLIVSLSPGMKKYIEKHHEHPNVISVTNAANIALFAIKKPFNGRGIVTPKKYAIYTGNIGAVNNFKFLLERANGTYFCWLGSDDRFAPEHIGLSVALLQKESDLIGCMAPAIFDYEVSTDIKPATYHFGSSPIQRIRIFFRNPGRSHGLFYGLYKVENLRSYRFLSREFFAWDWCLILHLLAQGKIGSTEKQGLISGSKGVSSSNLVYQHYGISGFKRLLPYSKFTKVTWSNLQVWSKGARVYLVYWLVRINIRYLLLERFEVKHWIKTRISIFLNGDSK
jgi:hypothetical protein